MKILQTGLFGSVQVVDTDDVTSPTPPVGWVPQAKNTTLMGVKASPLENSAHFCDKHKWVGDVAEWLVITTFDDRTKVIMRLCGDCKERYMRVYHPYSNTGTLNRIQSNE